MKIAMDLDGIFRGLIESLIYTYKIYSSGIDGLQVDDITEWDLAKFFPIGKEIFNWGFKEHVEEVFFKFVEPYEGWEVPLQNLCWNGHELTLLTYQNNESFKWTCTWLHFYGMQKYFKEIRIMINDTSKPGSGKEDTDYDLYIDDCPSVISSLLEKGKRVVCMNRPWNINEDLNCPRVNNLTQFYTLVGEIANEHKS